MSPVTNAVSAILQKLKSEGYECTQDVSLGPAQASLCGSRKVRWGGVFPYYIHYYVFDVSCISPVDLDYILGLNALARAHTDRFKHKRSRWFRLRIPITATVVLSPSGFLDNVVVEISKKKQRYQMGDVNSILLVDSEKRLLHSLQHMGLMACAPLKRIARHTSSLLEATDVL